MPSGQSPDRGSAAEALLPPGTQLHANSECQLKIGMPTAVALAIANMVGIGVFTSLGFQVKDIPSGFTVLTLWVLGGVLAVCGALCYAELATALPRSGGEYNFLTRIYGRAVGFMAGWISATVGFAAPAALAAVAFGHYLTGILPVVPSTLAALVLIWSATFVHLRGTHVARRFQDLSTLLKVALILVFILAGVLITNPQPVSFAPRAADTGFILSAPFATSLVYVMYSYSGWNAVTYIASEVRDPARTLPRSILVSVAVVTLLYVALNWVFLRAAPMEQLAGQLEIGLIAGRAIFGPAGGNFAGAIICLGLVSSVAAMLWIGPRIAAAMGEDYRALALFSKRSANGVPMIGTLLQAVIATLLVLTGSFEAVLEFIQFAITVCALLTVTGVIVLRRREPALPRPFRVWAYPLPPLIFMGATLLMLGHMVKEQPRQAIASIAMLAAGLAVYALSGDRDDSIAPTRDQRL